MDPVYCHIRDSSWCDVDRDLLSREWEQFKPLADRNFLTEFRRDFASRAWEMRVGCLLQRLGTKPHSADTGPDFGFAVSPATQVWVECVAPLPGSGADQVAEPPVGSVFRIDETAIMLRFSSALTDKYRKWKDQYVPASRVSSTDVFVVALNAAKIKVTRAYDHPQLRWIVRMLYGIGDDYIKFNVSSESEVEYGHRFRMKIAKASGTKVATAIFTDPRHAALSAVLYSLRVSEDRERGDRTIVNTEIGPS